MMTYDLKTLSVHDLNTLLEKGDRFYVKSTVLSGSGNNPDRDAFWNSGDESSRTLQQPDNK